MSDQCRHCTIRGTDIARCNSAEDPCSIPESWFVKVLEAEIDRLRERVKELEGKNTSLYNDLESALSLAHDRKVIISSLTDRCAKAESELERVKGALWLLVKDVQDYEAWQRPCLALDTAKAALAGEVEG